MKKQKQVTSNALAIVMTVCLVYFSSCKKEETPPLGNGTTDVYGGTLSRFEHNCNSLVFPANSHMYGNSYAQWSALWWKWAMEFPMTGHPFVDDPGFQVNARQSGQVWFLAAPFGTVVRTCTIPHNKSLFVGLLNAEASDLEGLGNTYTDQRANAKFNADHIRNLTCTIDGNTLANVTDYRFVSPQFTFHAPTPWIFGATGGTGTSVGDGYYIMIKPLSHGMHDLHYTGNFHFAIADGDPFDYDAAIDMTYHLITQ